LQDLFASAEEHWGHVHEMQLARRNDPLHAHLERLGRVARDRTPNLRRAIEEWDALIVANDVPLETETRQRVMDIASIVSLMRAIRGTWSVLADVRHSPTG
jgi:hypothetical protein